MTKKRGIATSKIIPVTALLPLELYNGNRLRLYKGNLHQISKSILNGSKGKRTSKSKFFGRHKPAKYCSFRTDLQPYYSIETNLDTE